MNLSHNFAFLPLAMLLLLTSCDLFTGPKDVTSAITNVVPVISFNPDIGTRSVVPAAMTNSEATFFFFCPALTGFTERSGGVSEGEALAAQPFLNTSVVFTVTTFTGGVNGIPDGVRFRGNFADGSGSILVELDDSNTKFWYEQSVFVDDPYKVVDLNKAQKSVIHQVISGSMNSSDLSLLGESSFGYYTIVSDETEILFTAPRCEFYSGPWDTNNAGQTGAGLAILQMAFVAPPSAQYGAVQKPSANFAAFGEANLAATVDHIKAFGATSPTLVASPSLIYKTSTDLEATKLLGGMWTGVNSALTAKDHLPSSVWKSKSVIDTYAD